MDNTIFLIFAMASVTYIPRLIPFFLVNSNKLPKRMNAFLKCIPVAAIGALIIPGVFNAVPGESLAVILGMGFALIIGIWRGGIIIPVLGSVLTTYLVLLTT
jgi:branched-subunit amino acid transport protein